MTSMDDSGGSAGDCIKDGFELKAFLICDF